MIKTKRGEKMKKKGEETTSKRIGEKRMIKIEKGGKKGRRKKNYKNERWKKIG